MTTVNNAIGTISLRHSKIADVKLDFATVEKEAAPGIEKSYIIAVTNLSSHCLTIAGTRRIGGSDAEWKWFPIPKTCRNCTTSYEQCVREGRYSAIMSTDCTSAPFELFVGYKISDTEVRGGVVDVRPNCSFPGGVIGFTD